MSLQHEPDLIRSFDGTIIAARSMGGGAGWPRKGNGPPPKGAQIPHLAEPPDRRTNGAAGAPLLLANAIGANLAPWRAALGPLSETHRILTWDHRGLLESLSPATERIDAGAHAEDALAVTDHYGIDRFDVVAWSTGARIALEIAHRYPERIGSLVLVCGGYGYSLRRLLRHLEIPSVMPFFAGISKYFAGPVESAFRAFVSRPELPGLIRQSGMVAGTADIRAFADMLRGASECDLRTLLAIYQAVVGDPAPELLVEIEARTLLIAGERDQFTSLRMVEEMERSIPDARLKVYERATHFLPLEYPARLAEDLADATSIAGRSRAAPH